MKRCFIEEQNFGAILYLSLALGVTVSAVCMFGRIVIMIIKVMVQQLSENIDHLVVIQELV